MLCKVPFSLNLPLKVETSLGRVLPIGVVLANPNQDLKFLRLVVILCLG